MADRILWSVCCLICTVSLAFSIYTVIYNIELLDQEFKNKDYFIVNRVFAKRESDEQERSGIEYMLHGQISSSNKGITMFYKSLQSYDPDLPLPTEGDTISLWRLDDVDGQIYIPYISIDKLKMKFERTILQFSILSIALLIGLIFSILKLRIK